MPKPFEPLFKMNYTEQRADAVGFFYNKKQVFRNFVVSVDADIDRINSKIEMFNKEEDPKNRYNILIEINNIRTEMGLKYPLYCMSYCPEYQKEIHEKLWSKLQEQFQTLKTDAQVAVEPRSICEQMIDTMSPAKLSEFMRILWENDSGLRALRSLYSTNDKSADSDIFFKFLSSYSLSPITLSQDKNSQIVRIQSLTVSEPPFILKIESRDGLPKMAEKKLVDQNESCLVRTKIERQGVFSTGNKTMAANLVMVDLCHKGSLLESSQKSTTIAEKLHYFKQMASVFVRLQEKKIAFPDAKIENWLITQDNTLKIGDTKSFFFTTSEGNLDFTSTANQWSEILSTEHVMPPEVLQHIRHHNDPDAIISADKLHSYQLGKNIYEYLTQSDFRTLCGKHQFEANDFQFEVFKTELGKELMALIQALVKPNLEERLSSQAALSRLNILIDQHFPKEMQDIQNKIDKAIQCIERLKVDPSKLHPMISKRTDYIRDNDIMSLQGMLQNLLKLYGQAFSDRRSVSQAYKTSTQQLREQQQEKTIEQPQNIDVRP